MTTYQPTLHKPIRMNSRVIVPEMYLGENRKSYSGTVVGISMQHVIFTYIVLLDEPSTYDGEEIKAIVVPGPDLRGADGTDWRIHR